MNSRTIQFEIQKGPTTGFMRATPCEQRLSNVLLGLKKFTLIVSIENTENEYNWKIQICYREE